MTKYFLILWILLSQTSFCQTFDDFAKLGFDAQQNENYREAISQYLKAQKIELHNVSINRRIGLMYNYLPKYDSALFYYNLVLTENPKDTVSYYQRGFVYLDSGEYQKAVDDFTVVFNKGNNKNADASYNIAKGYMGLENYNKAIEY
jgi:tetratricopeptide (TPR) repeat protein